MAVKKKPRKKATRQESKQPREYLVVLLPDVVEPKATLRLMAIERTLSEANKSLSKLDPGALGRVAVLERKRVVKRRPSIVEVEDFAVLTRKRGRS